MNFLEQIFASLEKSGDAVVLQEMRDGRILPLTARQLLDQVMVGRAYLRRLRLKRADRCALLGHNSIQWVAMDLAIMAEGLTVVPLYARQAASELVAMMKDCSPVLICCGDQMLAEAIVQEWPEAPPHFAMSKVFTASRTPLSDISVAMKKDDVATTFNVGHLSEAKRCDAECGQHHAHGRVHVGTPG
jgi:long-subunit acyl-CoA synthetase (AMP-forming)